MTTTTKTEDGITYYLTKVYPLNGPARTCWVTIPEKDEEA